MALEIIAGTPPGGGQDRTARALAEVLEPEVMVTNLAGRGGGNAWNRLLSTERRPDLAAVSSPTLITNIIVGEAGIDHRDLTPLAMLYTEHSALVVRSGSGLETPSSLFHAIEEGAARISFATARGNMNHLIVAEIARHLGAPVSTLPIRVFDSALQAVADVVAGTGDIAVVSAASLLRGNRVGALTAVVVTSPERLGDGLAPVPTCVELGVPCVRGTWRGLVGPPGLGAGEIEAWEDLLAAAVSTERWKALLADNLWVDDYLGPDDTRWFLESERERMSRLWGGIGLETTVDNG